MDESKDTKRRKRWIVAIGDVRGLEFSASHAEKRIVMTKKDELFESLYRRYQSGVVAFLMKFGFPREEALDLAHDTFVRVYSSMSTWRGDAEWGYLKSAARNVALNEIRRRHTIKRDGQEISIDAKPDFELPTKKPVGEDELIDQEQQRRQRAQLATAIAELAERLREPLLMRLRGVPYKVIATTLGVSLDTVKTRIHEAKGKLRERLGHTPEELDHE